MANLNQFKNYVEMNLNYLHYLNEVFIATQILKGITRKYFLPKKYQSIIKRIFFLPNNLIINKLSQMILFFYITKKYHKSIIEVSLLPFNDNKGNRIHFFFYS